MPESTHNFEAGPTGPVVTTMSEVGPPVLFPPDLAALGQKLQAKPLPEPSPIRVVRRYSLCVTGCHTTHTGGNEKPGTPDTAGIQIATKTTAVKASDRPGVAGISWHGRLKWRD